MIGSNQFGSSYLGQGYPAIDLSRGVASVTAARTMTSTRRSNRRHIGVTAAAGTAKAAASASRNIASAAADVDNSQATAGAS